MTKVEYFTDPGAFFRFMADPENQVLTVRPVSDEMVYMTYEKEEDFADILNNVNVAIAAFVTCHARLRLYGFIEQLLPEQVAYFDTGQFLPFFLIFSNVLPFPPVLDERDIRLRFGDCPHKQWFQYSA